MLYLDLRLLGNDRDELLAGLHSVLREVETAHDLESYCMSSMGALPHFLLNVDMTEERDLALIDLAQTGTG